MTLLLPIGILLLIAVLRRLQIWWTERAFAASHNCQRPPKLSRFVNLKQQMQAWKRHDWLDMWCRRYSTVGTTFESASVSMDQIIFTIDPENIKAVLATDFKTFDLGDRRRRLMGPLIGTGIFTSDGKAWEHSRVSEQFWETV